jgi:hypothetical protein
VTDKRPSKYPIIHLEEIDATSLERDPRKCLQIREFPVNLKDEIRRAYLRASLVHVNLFLKNIHLQDRIIVVVDFKLLGSKHTQVGWSIRD